MPSFTKKTYKDLKEGDYIKFRGVSDVKVFEISEIYSCICLRMPGFRYVDVELDEFRYNEYTDNWTDEPLRDKHKWLGTVKH